MNADQAVEAAAVTLAVCCTLDGGTALDALHRAHAAVDDVFDHAMMIADHHAEQASTE